MKVIGLLQCKTKSSSHKETCLIITYSGDATNSGGYIVMPRYLPGSALILNQAYSQSSMLHLGNNITFPRLVT